MILRLRCLFVLAAVAPMVLACTSVTKGTVQTIRIATSPAGARCEMTRPGMKWRMTTQATADVPRSDDVLVVTCRRAGYHDAYQTIRPRYGTNASGSSFVRDLNAVSLGAEGGADNAYPALTEIELIPSDLKNVGQPHDRAPLPLAGQVARYPETAQRNEWEGTVAIAVDVDGQGRVIRSWIKRTSGYEVLDNAALESVRNWMFQPALGHGALVPGSASVEIVYAIPEKTYPPTPAAGIPTRTAP